MAGKGLNEEPEVGNQILDEANKRLQNTLQNKDLASLSVAEAMIETTHEKIKSANIHMILKTNRLKMGDT